MQNLTEDAKYYVQVGNWQQSFFLLGIGECVAYLVFF